MQIVHIIFSKIVDLFYFFDLIYNEKLDSFQKDGLDRRPIFLLLVQLKILNILCITNIRRPKGGEKTDWLGT